MLSTAVQNLIMILALVLALFVISRNLRAISFAGISREVALIAIGMVVWCGFLIAQLLFHVVGPSWISDPEMLRIGAVIQNWVRWSFEAAAMVFVLAGVVQLTWRFGRLMQSLEQSTAALEHEYQARSTLEAELKASVMSQRAYQRQESEFLLRLSHELRTPLNGIVGLGSLLGNTKLDPDQRKLLGTLEQSAQAMLARVGAVIDLSSLRTQKVEVRNQLFSPAELVRSIEALFAPAATEKGLVFSSEISELADAKVIGDSRLTKQLLSTLASLAIKYSPAGSIRTLIDLEMTTDEIAWLTFTAIATSLEFPPDVIERVRDEFGSTRDDGGIGLAICWRIATLLDGSLEIESQAGVGTVVTVRLPMRRDR